MLIKTKSREDAYRAVINVWLKDKTIYCNECGKTYSSMINQCQDPECLGYQIGTNMDHCMGVIKQNKELTKTRKNIYSSVKDKSLRWGVSLPISLFYTLDNWKKQQGFQGFLREKGEINWFMRKFPCFRIPEKV